MTIALAVFAVLLLIPFALLAALLCKLSGLLFAWCLSPLWRKR